MKLQNIGFYTLSDDRAKAASTDSTLSRCELILRKYQQSKEAADGN